jgi:hypothetical protein
MQNLVEELEGKRSLYCYAVDGRIVMASREGRDAFSSSKGKGTCKGHPRSGQEDPEGE